MGNGSGAAANEFSLANIGVSPELNGFAAGYVCLDIGGGDSR